MEKSLERIDTIVALRKESVDRNLVGLAAHRLGDKSLSARRAWIEIRLVDMSAAWNRVALRKESVDRNLPNDIYYRGQDCRSPQGERG